MVGWVTQWVRIIVQSSEKVFQVCEEDVLRADMYSFLASLLRTEPSDALIQEVSGLKGDGTPIGSACLTLAHLAKSLDNEAIRNEKNAAVSEIKKQVAGLSIEIAEKLLSEKLSDNEKQMKIVDELLKDVKLK